jgi:SAM-dependent MidA family methyltransferase
LFLPIAGKKVPDSIVPEDLRDAPPGSIIETSPASIAIIRALAKRVADSGGAALIIDYGYDGPAIGETLQAVKDHAPANPFDAPGEHDLSAHVDFATLAAMAQLSGAKVIGPTPQGAWLTRIGLDERAESLRRASPDKAASLEAQRIRLADPRQMGRLFRVMAVMAPDWPDGEGFGRNGGKRA